MEKYVDECWRLLSSMAGLLRLTVIFFYALTLGMLGSLFDNHPEFQLAIISVGPGMGNNDWI